MIRFVLLDVRGLARKPWRVFAALAFLVLFSTALVPAFAVPLAAAFCVVIVSDVFLTDERGRLDILYATLPVSRATIVVGRYVTAFVVYLAAAVAGNAIAIIAPSFGGPPIGPGILALVNVAGFLVAALGLAVQLPVFFAVGYTRARFVILLPALAVLAAMTLGRKSFLSGRLAASLTGSIPVPFVVIAVAVGVALLAVSALAARAAYRGRSL
jgi:ABC-type transport system involved in multi-copper enzyme maturation permease subunit